jgi:DNA-binding response OmpR family regulator
MVIATVARSLPGEALVERRTNVVTVLLIEDDAAMRALLHDVLQRAGHRVITCVDDGDVMDIADREPARAVILDKAVPDADGLTLLTRLRTRLPDVPVVFISPLGGSGVAQEARRRGAHRCLEKPFRLESVLLALSILRDTAPRVKSGIGD